ncbi:MAG: malectin domain-containing carbohydrate-binding protein, partial [Pseudomonadota bacterium]
MTINHDLEPMGVAWAVNIGGEQPFSGMDGIEYEAESPETVQGGVVRTLDHIKGSQDAELYLRYRSGDVRIQKTLPNGHYDVLLHFAEPEGGGRVFDVVVNGEHRVHDLDIMGWRDGQPVSALTVATADVEVTDGTLNIHFDTKAGEPVVSAVVVRKRQPMAEHWKLVWSDEFDYEGRPDPANWTHDIWEPGKVNEEDQHYTDREKNVRVEDGMLVIEAPREDYEGAHYTSGRIHTAGKA